MVHVFGIRHHGAGSASSLYNALADLQPDCILIEGPPDADALIEYVANENLVPPVALLIYNPTDLKQAAYYPFAHFSPEWQAMKFGVENNIPTKFMDLPRSVAFAFDKKEQHRRSINFKKSITQIDEKDKIATDPFRYLANLAGYEDSERWWDITFERSTNSIEIFESILSLMTELRAAQQSSALRNLQREAYMRLTIRAMEKEGFQKIAVICGAWHTPVLADWKKYKAASDKKFLKGIKKIKTKATWVSWTYKRIARLSGYGAGIISPAWYGLLFDKPAEVTIQWMSKAAHLLRTEKIDVSAAHIIEAVRLANSLAAIRNLPVPGIQELKEAAITTLCEGAISTFQLIEDELIIGNKIGEVPEEIPVVPLQQDFNQAVKSARLTKEKKAFASVEKILDLRKSTNLAASHLLHQLGILAIPWGVLQENSHHTKGSFKEIWHLEWDPDFAIRIIEAGMWGNTLQEAATNFLLEKHQKQSNIDSLTRWIEAALKANLETVIPSLTEQLINQSAVTKDIFNLMQSLPPLVNIIRYGSSRNISLASIKAVINQIIPRICIGLPSSCINIDEEVSQQVFKKIIAVNRAIHTLNNPNHIKQWYQALEIIMGMTTNGSLVGLSTRILFDKQYIDADTTTTFMRLALSKGSDTFFSAQWIEGFLNGSGLLLIYNEQLWQVLDNWVVNMTEEYFMETLAILRRTFSKFAHPEREKMLQLARKQPNQLTEAASKESLLSQERVGKVLPTLKLLLDLQ